jgi:hypothetical protein
MSQLELTTAATKELVDLYEAQCAFNAIKAKLIKSSFDELMAAGFTESQAMAMIANKVI